MILLFPSPAKSINTTVNSHGNFGKIMTANLEKKMEKQEISESTKLLSFILVYLCNPGIKDCQIISKNKKDSTLNLQIQIREIRL